MNKEERVACVSLPACFEMSAKFVALTKPIQFKNVIFVDRKEAETRYDIKQLVVFVILKRGKCFYVYRRNETEQRLKGKQSIGFGGHVCVDDHRVGNPFLNAAERELKEEGFGILRPYDYNRMRFIGHLYDDSNDVGKMHLGCIYLLEAPAVHVDNFDLVDFEDLEKLELDNWSKILFQHFKHNRSVWVGGSL